MKCNNADFTKEESKIIEIMQKMRSIYRFDERLHTEDGLYAEYLKFSEYVNKENIFYLPWKCLKWAEENNLPKFILVEINKLFPEPPQPIKYEIRIGAWD